MRVVLYLLLLGCTCPAAEFSLNGRTLTVPAGFEVEVAAGPPLIERPMHAAYDERGRLYVAESSGSNDKVEKQLAEKPHRILRLEDSDGDGRFDKSVVFADKMMLPHGAMWLDGSLYVGAPPSIWKLTDTDDDGVADRREEWFKGGTLTGCANDMHGPFLGPDGWIYWCKGAFAEQTHDVAGKPFTSRASHIWRARPDGSRLEQVMTGGMDNPVELAFTPEGERIITCTFFQQPAAGRRDGLIHAIYGGVYGKQHDVLDGHLRTGPELMPVLTHLGPAAPAGLLRYRSQGLGAEYTNNLFAALFNLHKVSRHTLERDGATFKTRDEDFLSSTDSDFHPTDVLEDADGSLLVVDTGGWYKLCCPTSQLYKPDVLGAIYRVRRKEPAQAADSRGLSGDWQKATPAELTALLGDGGPAVQDRAQAELRRRGEAAVPALVDALDSSRRMEVRRMAVWTLAGIDAPTARDAVRTALSDPDDSVRQSAAQCAGLWKDERAAEALSGLLATDQAPLKRAAAEALGRLRAVDAIPALLKALPGADRVLAHSITYALIEIADPSRTMPALQSGVPAIREAALFALEQMNGTNRPQLADVRAWLLSPVPHEREVALWVMARHPEWAGEIARDLLAETVNMEALEERAALLARCATDGAVQSTLAAALSDEAAAPRRKLILRAMSRAPLKELPAAWAAALPRLLDGPEASLAIATLRALPPAKAQASEIAGVLLEIISDADRASSLRLDALAAMPLTRSPLGTPAFDFATAQLSAATPADARRAAVRVLAQAQLTEEQLATLADTLRTAGPTELPPLLAAFSRKSDAALGRRVLDAIRNSPGRAALDAATLKKSFAAFPAALREEATALLKTALPETQRNQLDALVAAQQGGDIRRGQAVFNSAKAACSTCHAIGYLGSNFGPDLTRIGGVRNERDLLEGIVFPSASFVRSYEPQLVTMKTGDVHSGLLRGDNAAELVLATGPAAEVHLRRDLIASTQPGTVSPMPQGYDQILTPQELADLVAFLRASR